MASISEIKLKPRLSLFGDKSVLYLSNGILFKGESRNGFIRQEDAQIFLVKAAFKSAVSDHVAKFYYKD